MQPAPSLGPSLTHSIEPSLGDRRIVPGKRVGSIELGMRYQDVAGVVGHAQLAVRERLAFLRYPALELDLILRKSAEDEARAEARVIAIAIAGGLWAGMPRPGDLRALVEESLGEATYVGERALYAAGVSVFYETSGRAATVVVRAPFLHDLFPAPQLAFTPSSGAATK
jgi:hypothetical protein